MYHRIADIPGDRNSVTPAMFERQMRYLSRHGYRSVGLSQLCRHLSGEEPLPVKTVAITFDDGYEDNLLAALPVLQKYGLTATVFVVAGWVGKYNDWEQYPGKPCCKMMDWRQLELWLRSGMEIGGHTVNHPFLSALTDSEIRAELSLGKKMLADRLHIPVDFLCYPYGDFDERVKRYARECGYKGAVAIFANTSCLKEDRFALKRVVISCRQPLWEFALKVSPLHSVFTGLRILEKQVKKWIRR
jgi:peptidoglycan/xylan/chitin deacetylase (PgdA/CDA1 family)